MSNGTFLDPAHPLDCASVLNPMAQKFLSDLKAELAYLVNISCQEAGSSKGQITSQEWTHSLHDFNVQVALTHMIQRTHDLFSKVSK